MNTLLIGSCGKVEEKFQKSNFVGSIHVRLKAFFKKTKGEIENRV